jgi:c-di-GMP-binding flagellar brake protein YcgR
MSQSNDERRHPRVAQRVRVRSSSREAVELETVDLSAGGLSCTAPAFLPLMTKMAISLVLPEPRASGSDEGNGHETVNGEAIVVRTEPPAPVEGKATYRVALFFSRMDDADRRRLLDFLARHTAKAAH